MTFIRTLSAAGLLAIGLTTPALADDRAAGTLIGAGVGAVIGHQIDGRTGAVIGGAIGAVAGNAIARDDDRDGRYRHNTGYYQQVHYAPPPRVVYQPVYYEQPRVVYQPVYPRHRVEYRPVKVVYKQGHAHGHDKRGWHDRDDRRDDRRDGGWRDRDGHRGHDNRWR